jgi:lipopolysaccharide export system protein LptA
MMSRTFAVAVLFASALATAAELQFGDEAISVAFDQLEIDMRKDEHQFSGDVRIAQGPMSIAADRAAAVGASRSDQSRWTFENNVHLQTAVADLHANKATAVIANGALTSAVVTGSPATFEQRNAVSGERARGRAGQIDYDVAKGIMRLTNDVWFAYGQNEFRGNTVVYYVNEERVVVNPGLSDPGRVNITVRPNTLTPPTKKAAEVENSR